MRWVRIDRAGWLVAMICGICGCQTRPNSAEVSGVVTLNGAPLVNAHVIFRPEAGRSSVGLTNDEGKYSLMFTGTKSGVLPGTHRISITTATIDWDGDGLPRKEIVPTKYRGPESELIQEVKPGRNTIDLVLRGQ